MLRRIALWLVFHGPRLPGDWAPRLFDFGMGQRGVEVDSTGTPLSDFRRNDDGQA